MSTTANPESLAVYFDAAKKHLESQTLRYPAQVPSYWVPPHRCVRRSVWCPGCGTYIPIEPPYNYDEVYWTSPPDAGNDTIKCEHS